MAIVILTLRVYLVIAAVTGSICLICLILTRLIENRGYSWHAAFVDILAWIAMAILWPLTLWLVVKPDRAREIIKSGGKHG